MKKIQNTKGKHHANTVIYLLLINSILGIVVFSIGLNPLKYPLLMLCWVIANSLVLLVVWLYGFSSFSYEGEGGVLSFKSQDYLKIEGHKLCEFPQKKLLQYKIIPHTLVRKKLILTIQSSSNHKTIQLMYNISCLTQEELDFLNSSLPNIIAQNQDTVSVQEVLFKEKSWLPVET